MTWDSRYRMLEEKETIQEGDEVLTDSHLGWQRDRYNIGKPAPSPYYSSHRMYRRLKDEFAIVSSNFENDEVNDV